MSRSRKKHLGSFSFKRARRKGIKKETSKLTRRRLDHNRGVLDGGLYKRVDPDGHEALNEYFYSPAPSWEEFLEKSLSENPNQNVKELRRLYIKTYVRK